MKMLTWIKTLSNKHFKWFECDIEAAQSLKEDSWLSRLGGVAECLVLNVVKNRMGLCKGAAPVRLNTESLRRLLERAQTAGTEDPNDNPPLFPIEKQAVNMWESIFDYQDESPPSAIDQTAEEATSKLDEVLNGSHLSIKVLAPIIKDSMQKDTEIREAVGEALNFEGSAGDQQDILLNYRPAKLYAQELSLTDLAYLNSSLSGQASITLQRVRDAVKKWKHATGMVALRLQQWERYEQELEEAERNLLLFENHSLGFEEILDERVVRLKKAIERIDAANGKDNYYSRKAEKDLNKPLDTPLNVRSSNAFSHGTPVGSPLPGSSGRTR